MSPVLFVLVSLGLISALLASVMIQSWRWIERAPHLLAWAAAHTAASLQWLCMLADQMLPGTGGFFWLAANALAITVLSCLLIGYRLRSKLAVGRVLLAGSGLLALAAVVWFSAVVPQPALSATVVPLYASILLALCCHALLSRGHPVLPAEWGSVVVLVLFALIQLGAGAAYSAPLAAVGGLEARAGLHFLTLPATYAGVGIFSILLIATDLAEQMKRLAIVDPLTGVLNRRGFLDAALRAVSHARRSSAPLALIMADLDEFKRLNDTYGHATGDRALRMFAGHLETALRRSDLVGRIGGEEFAVLLSGTDEDNARFVAERLCHSLERASLEAAHGPIRITSSFGVAVLGETDGDVEDLMERADRALYMAKETGRNRVCVASHEDDARDFGVA